MSKQSLFFSIEVNAQNIKSEINFDVYQAIYNICTYMLEL